MFDAVPWSRDPAFAADVRRRTQAADALVAIADELDGKEVAAAGGYATLHEMVRATRDLRALIHLVSLGLGSSAQGLAASLFRSSMAIQWALRNQGLADRRMMLHAQLGMELALERREAAGSPLPDSPRMDPADRNEALSLFELSAETLWTGHRSLGDLVEDVVAVEADDDTEAEMLRHHQRVMHSWSALVAATSGVGAIAVRGVSDADRPDFLVLVSGPAQNEHLFQALTLA